jgi:hypothetical protein
MSWIESHQSLRRHPKMLRAARSLGVDAMQMIGHLHCLWWWALDYAPDGDLSQYEPWEIAEGAGYEGDPDAFLAALVDCRLRHDGHGFVEQVEGRLLLHDWYDYAGKLVDKRAMDAERKRLARKKDVPRMSEGCPSERPRDGAGTVPNRTLPNLREEEDAPTSPKPKKEKAPVSDDAPAAQRWTARWIEGRATAGLPPPSKHEVATFGRKVKEIPDLDDLIMQDAVAIMVSDDREPTALPFKYGDCKRLTERELAKVRGGPR